MSFLEKIITGNKQKTELLELVQDKFAMEQSTDFLDEDHKQALYRGLAKKLESIEPSKLEDTLLTMQRYKDHIVSHWNENGTKADTNKGFDAIYNESKGIAEEYRDALVTQNIDKGLAESMLGTVTGIAAVSVVEVRDKYLNIASRNRREILPTDTFSR